MVPDFMKANWKVFLVKIKSKLGIFMTWDKKPLDTSIKQLILMKKV